MAAISNKHFVTFEGGDGAGKSTQIKLLHEWLQSTGHETILTREPGGTPGADAIREVTLQGSVDRWDAQTDTLLFMASRRDLLAKVIWPALARGDWVLCDRFVDSTYAYQAFGRGLDLDATRKVYDFVGEGFLPSVTFLFDIDPQMGLERVMAGKDRNAAETRYEKFDLGFHQRLREGYHVLAAAEPARFILIDAAEDRETVQTRLRDALTARMGM